MGDHAHPQLPQNSDTLGEEVSYPSDDPSSPTLSSGSLVTIYKPPTYLSLIRSAAINLVLPFINGVMLGFGEIFAHELAFRWGWRGVRVLPFGKQTHSRSSQSDERQVQQYIYSHKHHLGEQKHVNSEQKEDNWKQ